MIGALQNIDQQMPVLLHSTVETLEADSNKRQGEGIIGHIENAENPISIRLSLDYWSATFAMLHQSRLSPSAAPSSALPKPIPVPFLQACF